MFFLNDIKKGKTSLEEAKNLQQDYEKYLKETHKGNKSAEQKKTLANVNVLFNARNNAIKIIEHYGPMILEANRLAKQEGTGLRILSHTQMIQRHPLLLSEIPAGNDSESLGRLNEFRQIVYFCIDQKKLPKKYITT